MREHIFAYFIQRVIYVRSLMTNQIKLQPSKIYHLLVRLHEFFERSKQAICVRESVYGNCNLSCPQIAISQMI